jgi:hypothetical protein
MVAEKFIIESEGSEEVWYPGYSTTRSRREGKGSLPRVDPLGLEIQARRPITRGT